MNLDSPILEVTVSVDHTMFCLKEADARIAVDWSVLVEMVVIVTLYSLRVLPSLCFLFGLMNGGF